MPDPAARLAIVVPTRNLRGDLEQLLQSVRGLGDGVFEDIVVVDDASASRVVVPMGGSPAIRLIRNATRCGAARSRNVGAALSGGDVLVFLDDDARVDEAWLVAMREALSPDRAILTGPVVAFDTGPVARARQARYAARYRGLNLGDDVQFAAGGNMAVWRTWFEEVGGFADVPTMSDRMFVHRIAAAGGRCVFVPEMRIRHRNSKGLREAAVQAWRAGRWSAEAPRPPSIRGTHGDDWLAVWVNRALAALFLAGWQTERVLTTAGMGLARTAAQSSRSPVPHGAVYRERTE